MEILSYQNCKIFNTINVLLRITVVAGFLVAGVVQKYFTYDIVTPT